MKKPREWWLVVHADGYVNVARHKSTSCGPTCHVVKVREVLPKKKAKKVTR